MQLVQAVAASLMPPTGNVQRNVAGSVVVAIFCATAYVALVFCGWFAVNQAYGPVAASALVAAVAVVMASAAWAIVGVLNARSKRRAAEARRRAEEEMKRHAAVHENSGRQPRRPRVGCVAGHDRPAADRNADWGRGLDLRDRQAGEQKQPRQRALNTPERIIEAKGENHGQHRQNSRSAQP